MYVINVKVDGRNALGLHPANEFTSHKANNILFNKQNRQEKTTKHDIIC